MQTNTLTRTFIAQSSDWPRQVADKLCISTLIHDELCPRLSVVLHQPSLVALFNITGIHGSLLSYNCSFL
jgi:hypothetical protein